jgi:fibronectin type 3 domain-containing protein
MKSNIRALWAVLLSALLAMSLTGCGGGGGGDNKTTTTSAPATPSAPTGVTATSGNTQATISWNAVTGATSYNIYWTASATSRRRLLVSRVSAVTKTTGTKIAGVTSPYNHTGLTNGMVYRYVVTSVNNAGESAESSEVTAKPTAMPITSLSVASAIPTAPLVITGTGFGTAGTQSVRFFNSSGYQVDVQVIKATSTTAVVSVPPYFVSGSDKYEAGTVSVQVLQDSANGVIKSNSIDGFQIKDLPTHSAAPGTVTLNYLKDELAYLASLQAKMRNTSLDNPSLASAIAVHMANLTVLASQIRTVIQNQSATFSLGSIKGVGLTVNAKALLQSDRLILGMYKTLATTSLPAMESPFAALTQTAAFSMPGAGDNCQTEANARFDHLDDPDAMYTAQAEYQNCFVTLMPSTINKGFDYMTALGGVGVGILALAGAPEIALALPAAALLYTSVMGINTEFAIGAELHYINDTAAKEALHHGYQMTVDLLTDTVIGKTVGKVFGETAGTLYDLYKGLKTINQTFSETTQTSPLAGSWEGTYNFTVTGSFYVEDTYVVCTVHNNGDMTTTLTVSGNAVTGNEVIWTGYVDEVYKDCSIAHTTAFTLKLVGTITGNTVIGKLGDPGDESGEGVSFTGTFTSGSFQGNIPLQTGFWDGISYSWSGTFSLIKKNNSRIEEKTGGL